jgi:hypothetical protein
MHVSLAALMLVSFCIIYHSFVVLQAHHHKILPLQKLFLPPLLPIHAAKAQRLACVQINESPIRQHSSNV